MDEKELKTMSHKQLLAFVNDPSFHDVKHTAAFQLLTERLIKSETVLAKVINMIKGLDDITNIVDLVGRPEPGEWVVPDGLAWIPEMDSTPTPHMEHGTRLDIPEWPFLKRVREDPNQ